MRPQAYSYLRMSTDTQLRGDSRRRQLEASRAYAAANDLELVEGAELEDIGVSAFRGANVRDGALGQFLRAVKEGVVKPGSFLIVESLDRLSREQVLTAQSLFLSIIQAGINLVTLTDNRVYRAGETELADLIVSLVIMSRAHEESQTKSHRVRAAWMNKRSKAASVPMSRICPAWLELSSDRTRYAEVPERVEIVRRIFNEAAAGVGMYSIQNRLNKDGVPGFGSSNGWHQSYVAKILGNRAVLGEFQPHTTRNGKRIVEGDPIKGYFPAIIDEQLFYRAQLDKSERKKSGAGRKGLAYSNLFSGLAKCAYCGSSMTFENKGAGKKGNTYLICDSARRRLGCNSRRWRYCDFEASFLAFVEEADLSSMLHGPGSAEREILRAELNAVRGRLASVVELMEKAWGVLEAGGPRDFVSSKLNELAERRKELKSLLQSKTQEYEDSLSREAQYLQSKEEIKALLNRLQGPPDSDLYSLRARVAGHLRSIVSVLSVASAGYRPRLQSRMAQLRKLDETGALDVRDKGFLEYLGQQTRRPDSVLRHFSVGFRDGRVRIVYPKEDAPLEYEKQMTVNETDFFKMTYGDGTVF